MEGMQIFKHRLDSYGKRGCNWPHKHYRATGLRVINLIFYKWIFKNYIRI